MGDRANIILEQEEGGKIYLYTHWGGSELKHTLANALDRGRERWDDEGYLSRIIFSEMIQGDVLGLTGYGLTTYMTDGDNNVLTVNIAKKKVDDISFTQFIKRYKEK